MAVAVQQARCPKCRESIHPEATRCKHCQADLGAEKARKRSIFSRFNTFRIGFLCGLIFSIVLAILAYFQFKG